MKLGTNNYFLMAKLNWLLTVLSDLVDVFFPYDGYTENCGFVIVTVLESGPCFVINAGLELSNLSAFTYLCVKSTFKNASSLLSYLVILLKSQGCHVV